jgi:hypothetical protein
MAVTITDLFNGPVNTAITSHSTDTGQNYVRPVGGASGSYYLDGLGSISDGNSGLGAFAVVDVTLDSNAYRPEVYMNAGFQMVIYQSVKAATQASMYLALWHSGVGEFICYRYTNGVQTEIFRGAAASSPIASPGFVGLQRSGNVIQLTKNGVVVASAADPAPLTDPGTGGFSGSGMESFQITGSATIVGGTTDSPPTITSNGGGATASISVAEDQSVITTVTATDLDGDAITFGLAGGADAAKAVINPTTGVLSWITSRDFEAPDSAAGTNVYLVTVSATANGATDTQALTITVTDVIEAPPIQGGWGFIMG